MELWQFLGNLHPKLVQLPIVLLLAGLLFDLAGAVYKSARAHWAAICCTAAGTLGLLFAFICGIYAEIWAGRAGIPQDPIELHELVANFASWGFVLLLAWRIFLNPDHRKKLATYLAIGFSWYLLLVLTAYLGGQIVFQYGAAVTGAHANTVLTLSDLNTLATRQTDENLRYSEWMHHIFGFMTLGLAASLLVQAVFPKHKNKVKWIVPTFLLAGGIFLFFFADLDLYRFTDPRQWRDREVMLHKSLAIIMATIGAVGLLKTFRPKQIENRKSKIENPSPSQSKWVAVLALIGGSMLFTHVHTVAPYANVAAGVYIAHVVLGLIALSIGATRLAQDFLPQHKRALAVSFALFMAVESVLLITYNEGLPWYIGYGRYNRWGPTQSAEYTVAPFGDTRAILHVDTNTGTAHIDLKDRFTDESRPLKQSTLQLLISRGYAETALPLHQSSTDESHFEAQADFLKSIPAFSARLALPTSPGHSTMGYFDPWVTPVVSAVPPNESPNYFCPMHDGIRSAIPGNCPLCGMELLPVSKAIRPPNQLHDPDDTKDFTATADPASPTTAHLRFLLKKSDNTIPTLALVHSQLLHLIIVSDSLDYFDHVHPVLQPDHSLILTYTFPKPGRYLLYTDMTPKGDRAEIFRLPVTVTPTSISQSPDDSITQSNSPPQRLDPRPRHKLVPSSSPAGKTPQDSAAWYQVPPVVSDDPIHVELLTPPRTLYAGHHASLLFHLSDSDGRPLTDLRLYIAAMGHCVLISEDTTAYLHCHPEQLLTPRPDDRAFAPGHRLPHPLPQARPLPPLGPIPPRRPTPHRPLHYKRRATTASFGADQHFPQRVVARTFARGRMVTPQPLRSTRCTSSGRMPCTVFSKADRNKGFHQRN